MKNGRNKTTLLAIETSCDDTCVAVLEAKKLKAGTSFKILSSVVHTQLIHKEYGGVFPAMAKREHLKNMAPVYEKAMSDAKKFSKDLKIDAITVTVGPGLEPALWVGITFAKELGGELNVPVLPVNHMEGHIYSIFPGKASNNSTFTIKDSKKIFPALSLLISGGHTELVLSKDWQKYEIIGSTRDDAAGEAFDKVARMLGLSYPGGPEISRLAKKERRIKNPSSVLPLIRGGGTQIQFPRPMIHSKDYDFSFSGLKTAVLYYIRDHGPLTDNMKPKIAREFEEAVVDVLIAKTLRAIEEYRIKTLIVGGGVSANKYLQSILKKTLKKASPKTSLHFPTPSLTSDNALMIAITGYFQYQNKKSSQPLKAIGNLHLS